jgi:pilus assembly protein CpaB
MRRTLGIIAALAIAGLGTLLLVGYVRGAEDRALAGEELVEVLVVDTRIAKGTPAAVLGGAVRLERVPTKVSAEGGISDLATLGDFVASTDLLPGEQVTAQRFVAEEALSVRTAIEPPAGTIAVTISISPDRALGGAILPGDVVAVIASFDPFDLNTVEPSEVSPGEVINPDEIFIGSTDGEATTDDGPALAPTGNLLVTLAAAPEDAERIVFTAEHGAIWLGAVSGDTPEPSTPVRTRENIYR